jgi:hypothetical protein
MRSRKPKWAMEWKEVQRIFGRERIFGDRKYLLWESPKTKEGADKKTEELRSVGFLARVTSEKSGKKTYHLVWACKK